MPEGSEPELSPRASDAERNQTVDRLRTAFVEGRLNDEEFDERMRTALTARTHADLGRLLADLPQAPGMATPATVAPSPLISRPVPGDRKSTRLNSSHPSISYAVFCLK